MRLLSGLGRACAVLMQGWAAAPLVLAMVAERAGSIGLAAWPGAVKRTDARRGPAPDATA